MLWNASRRVSQVCWPAATAARAGRSVLYSMVADVRYDDGLALRNADGKKCAVGASSALFVRLDNDHVNMVAASAAVGN